MLSSILWGIIRHLLTIIGGAIFSHAVQTVSGSLQVQDLAAAVTGGVMTAVGVISSVAQKVKTKSGPDYTGFNR